MKNQKLSPEIIEQIRELRRSGLTGKEIANRLGVGKSVVYKYTPRMGKQWKKWDENQIQVMTDGYAKGLKPAKIAKKLGRNTNQVKIRMCRYRKEIRADPKKREVLRLLAFGFRQGARPGQVINGIRKTDMLGRIRDVL
jgi:hypothetical protein